MCHCKFAVKAISTPHQVNHRPSVIQHRAEPFTAGPLVVRSIIGLVL